MGGRILSLPRCQILANTLTSLSIHITNLLQDLHHVSFLTNLTQLQLSTSSAQAHKHEALDQMIAQITQTIGLKALRLLGFPHSLTKSVSQGLPNLQLLEANGIGPVVDVQTCTQLTSLFVGEGAITQVHLPAGQMCCLEQLSLNIGS